MEIGHAIKCAVTGMPALIFGGRPGCRAGDERLARNRPELKSDTTVPVESAAFGDGSAIPAKYSSSEGQNVSPPLRWSGVPLRARSLVLIVEDPDAPTPKPFVHWLLYNIPPDIGSIPEDVPHNEVVDALGGAMQGKNSQMKIGWIGMAPPKGDTPHHYHFQLFALDERLPLAPGAGRSALFEAMCERVLAAGEVVGTYQR
jgi:Raf kinase inhibitor-like YbhB/YbcL family protein